MSAEHKLLLPIFDSFNFNSTCSQYQLSNRTRERRDNTTTYFARLHINLRHLNCVGALRFFFYFHVFCFLTNFHSYNLDTESHLYSTVGILYIARDRSHRTVQIPTGKVLLGSEVIKKSCSTQLSMQVPVLINFIFMSRKNFILS